MRRPLLTFAAVTTAALALSLPVSAQDAKSSIDEAVAQLRAGQKAEALDTLQSVLTVDMSNREALELWQTVEYDHWVEIMVAGDQFDIIAKRIQDLAMIGRKERSADEDAIRELLPDVTSNDIAKRTAAVTKLAANHGEYAVPLMVYSLGDNADGDQRTLTMMALTKMGDDVVLPLIAALRSGDAHMRRNVALTLGYIKDPRANAALAERVFEDSESPVKAAASQALELCGGTTDVAAQYLALGDAYYSGSDSVLKPHQYRSVVWDWEGGGLVATEIPGFLYSTEMAKRAYQSALAVAPDSTHALAGLARSVVSQSGQVTEWVAAGRDAGDWPERIEADTLAVSLAGADALEVALGWALDAGDQVAAIGLCQALATSASAPTANLNRALTSRIGGAVRGEAGIAAAQLAKGAATADVVAALGEAASRQVLQIAAIIDSNEGRAKALEGALASRGLLVNSWKSGGRGLGAIRTVSGVDVVLVADQLSDISLNQVVHELRRDPRTSDTPIFVIASSPDGDYGDLGVVAGAEDVDGVIEALDGELDRDRMQANELAARAAKMLWKIGSHGANISAAVPGLAGTLSGRPDDVTTAALGALGVAGGATEVGGIVSVLADGGRSEDVRVAAAHALAGIFSRTGAADAAAVEAIGAVASGDDAFAVRSAAASALGHLELSGAERATLISGVRGL